MTVYFDSQWGNDSNLERKMFAQMKEFQRTLLNQVHTLLKFQDQRFEALEQTISKRLADVKNYAEVVVEDSKHAIWMDVSNILQQMQEKEEKLTEDIINLKNEMNTKLDTKVQTLYQELDTAVDSLGNLMKLTADCQERGDSTKWSQVGWKLPSNPQHPSAR